MQHFVLGNENAGFQDLTPIPRAGARVRRLGDGLRQARRGARGPRHAHLDGFDLHANVWVDRTDRVRLKLKRPWSDGTTHLHFEPVEFLEKLAAVTPRPEINLVLYHGVLAPLLDVGGAHAPGL